MISDNDLKIAAEKASTAILETLPEVEHEFSPEHERQIAAIGRKARLKKVLSAAAVILLVIIAGGVGVLTFSPEARAELESTWNRLIGNDGWPSYINGEEASASALMYRPTWLPDGYEVLSENADFGIIEYRNGLSAITYGCTSSSADFLSAVECTSHEVTVGGTTATVYVPVENEFNYTRKTLAFIKGGCLITITADLDEPELIKIAESVKLSDN